MGSGRGYLAGAGTQTAGLAFGGTPIPSNGTATEEYNGSSWTAGGALNTARKTLAGGGLQTAGLAFGGSPPTTGATEKYNGSSWTSTSSMNQARTELAGAGLQTAALAFSGDTPPSGAGTATEEFSEFGPSIATIETT